jgi:hypothetical protein
VVRAFAHGAAGALRLRIEGRSATRADRLPAWVDYGTDFAVLDFTSDPPGIVLGAPSLEEALPERFQQGDLFSPIDPRDSALSLLATSLQDASAGRVDSDAFDMDLLGVFARDFARLFRGSHVESIGMRNGRIDSPRVDLDPTGLRVLAQLRDRTPRPRRVRLAGQIDVIRYSTCTFVMRLADGSEVRGVLIDEGAETLRPHFGKHVVVEGVAQFRPSGRLLRVDVDRLHAATARDLAAFSAAPRPLEGVGDPRRARRIQSSTTGINAIIGRWPGEESDADVNRILREIS